MESIIATITDLTHDQRGIARVDGKTTFIKNALPGEQVHYTLQKRHRNYDEGIATEIVESSPQRTTPACPHFGICGGCSAQHMTHAYQIEHKQALLLQHLTHFGRVSPESVLPPLLGPVWQYRHKARLGVRYVQKKQKVLVGFREANGRYIAELDTCEVLHPAVGQRLSDLAQLIEGLACREQLPQIEVAIGEAAADSNSIDGAIVALIVRHLEPLITEDLESLHHFAQRFGFHLYLQPQGPDSIHRLWPAASKTPEDDYLFYSLPAFNLRLEFHPSDFTQVNPLLNQGMVQQAIELLNPQADEQILDLFCGLGNFTLPLATRAQQVVGVEGSDAMVARASYNATLNGIHNTSFYRADLAAPWTDAPWSQPVYHKLLLDPPRSGAQAIVEQIQQINPQRILYVSCNPATLARDAGILVHEKGYRLLKAGIMDMFPHTAHVESMALFEK